MLTTAAGAERLGDPVRGLAEWETTMVGDVTVTAVPALHGPPGCEEITGPVIGFVLSSPGLETVYVGGDNASLDVVAEVGRSAGPIEIAILNAGAVQIPQRFDGAYLTLSADRAAMATIALDARVAIPLHFEGWTHFTQGADELRSAFAGNGVGDRLRLPGARRDRRSLNANKLPRLVQSVRTVLRDHPRRNRQPAGDARSRRGRDRRRRRDHRRRRPRVRRPGRARARHHDRRGRTRPLGADHGGDRCAAGRPCHRRDRPHVPAASRRQDRDAQPRAGQDARRPLDGLHAGRRACLRRDQRGSGKGVPVHDQAQHGCRRLRRHCRARPRRHRPARRDAGDGGQGDAVQGVRGRRRASRSASTPRTPTRSSTR